MTKKKVKVGSNTIALNKRARHEYFIEDEIEAGLELQGWEVKSMRNGIRGGHEVGGRAYPPRHALHPRVPHVAAPTYFFLLYIPTYPQTTRYGAKNLIPPPQPSVPVRSHLGTFSGILPEGDSITEGFFINTIASPMMRE